MQSLTYIEIDVDWCSLVYGTAPCTASIPTTGAEKCFNTKKTCQDRTHYANSIVTLRFAVPTDYLPREIEAMPNVKSVSLTPATVNPGVDFGTRATLTVVFGDHKHSDTGLGFDKYVAERAYDPFNTGTMWGKFRARQPYLWAKPCRLIRGVVGQSLSEMDVWHYVIDSSSGPSLDGTFTIVAKDALKLADNEKSKAPTVCHGYLQAAITAVQTTATLAPSGVGADYPTSGYLCIGGSEVCSFTRSGDSLTLVRGQLGTTSTTHSAQDRCQVALRYVAQDVADIIRDLLVNYASVPSDYVPLTDWKAETAANLQQVYTATICEPTGVQDIVTELIEQAALGLWWDARYGKIRLQVLRSINTNAALFDESNTMARSVSIKDQPEKRKSQVWTFFAPRDPTKSLTDKSNYQSIAATVDLEAEADYGTPMVHEIFSRWIATGGRTAALKLNALQLARFRTPPRRISFDIWRHGYAQVDLGAGYKFASWPLQDAAGRPAISPIQVVRLDNQVDKFRIEAEEMLFDYVDYGGGTDPNDHYITIDFDLYNVNLRTLHDALFPTPTASTRVFVTIESGVFVGSTSSYAPAFVVGSWPSGAILELTNNGRIQGKGGDGGKGGGQEDPNPGMGQPGGTALNTARPLRIRNNGGIFGGGGGGGGGGRQNINIGGSGGGGGRGKNPGSGGQAGNGMFSWGNNGLNGNSEYPGGGGPSVQLANQYGGGGGQGGEAGQPGANGGQSSSGENGASGGTAGKSIEGASNITWLATGDIRGAQV